MAAPRRGKRSEGDVSRLGAEPAWSLASNPSFIGQPQQHIAVAGQGGRTSRPDQARLLPQPPLICGDGRLALGLQLDRERVCSSAADAIGLHG